MTLRIGVQASVFSWTGPQDLADTGLAPDHPRPMRIAPAFCPAPQHQGMTPLCAGLKVLQSATKQIEAQT